MHNSNRCINSQQLSFEKIIDLLKKREESPFDTCKDLNFLQNIDYQFFSALIPAGKYSEIKCNSEITLIKKNINVVSNAITKQMLTNHNIISNVYLQTFIITMHKTLKCIY